MSGRGFNVGKVPGLWAANSGLNAPNSLSTMETRKTASGTNNATTTRGRLRGLGEPVAISHPVPPRVGNPAADEGVVSCPTAGVSGA
jgi:hypothetical protein